MVISRRVSVITCLALIATVVAVLAPVAEAARPRCFGRRATIVGTTGSDRLRGTPRRDVIVAKGGRDIITARGGGDFICAGAGRDSISLGGGADRVAAGDGMDDVSGGGGADRIFLEGGSEESALGGRGNDVIDLGPGFFQFAVGGGGNDEIIGFTPEQGSSSDFVGYFGAPGPVTADLAAGQATGHGSDTLIGIDAIEGSEHDDSLTGHAGSNFLFGGPGNDVINDGGNDGSLDLGPDAIIGGAFLFDALSGGNGDDTFNGQGSGVHVVFYDQAADGVAVDLQAGVATGEGTDTLNGINVVASGPGDDTLEGDGNTNAFDGGAGNDMLDGRGGEDTVIMFDAVDATADLGAGTATGGYLTFTEQGEEDRPFVWTLAGMENIWGSDRGADTLRGDEGPNELFGLAGADQLFGLGGPDLLDGGGGSDTGDGGAATDECISIENETNCEGTQSSSSLQGRQLATVWMGRFEALEAALR